MAYTEPDQRGRNMNLIYGIVVGGIALALLFHFLLPPKRVPPPERTDAIGCYAAPGWPVVTIDDAKIMLPGAPEQDWSGRIFKDSVGLTIAPGFAAVRGDAGTGRFDKGDTVFLYRLDRDDAGKLHASNAQGRIDWLDVGGVAFERTACEAPQPVAANAAAPAQ